MGKLARWVLSGLLLAVANSVHAAEAQDGVQAQDVGLLILAFLILVPLYIALRVIPGWIESYHNVAEDMPQAILPKSPETEADG